ncbi:Protein AE7-like 1 [Ananas comosus]|uniref:Protein AE7-like 1 n=1 Tax=Ananas comosus TaxID=4615 RepID=A0A199VDJ2_ANACO|nr:Protein AE7-like 1 [Ananas comosus]
MTLGLINANPVVHETKKRIARAEDPHPDDAVDPLDVYDSVRDIRDPEHPYSLEQLSVLSEESITVDEKLVVWRRLSEPILASGFLGKDHWDLDALQYW